MMDGKQYDMYRATVNEARDKLTTNLDRSMNTYLLAVQHETDTLTRESNESWTEFNLKTADATKRYLLAFDEAYTLESDIDVTYSENGQDIVDTDEAGPIQAGSSDPNPDSTSDGGSPETGEGSEDPGSTSAA